MSAMATSIRTVTTTWGVAAMTAREPSHGARMVDRPAIASQAADAARRSTRLDFAGRIIAYRDARAGGATGRCHAMTCRDQRRIYARIASRCSPSSRSSPPWPSPAASRPSRARPSRRPRKLDIAYLLAPPESGAIGLKFMAEEVTKRSNGAINMVFHGGTLLNKELEIMDAVKSGNVAIGTPDRRRLDGVPRDGRLPDAVSRARLPARLLDVQRPDRQGPRRDVPEEVQGQGPVLLRLRLPPLLEQQAAHQHAGRPQGPEDARAAGQASSPTPSTASAPAPCRCPGARSSPPPSRASSTAPTCRSSTSTRSRSTRSRSTPR